MSYSFRKSIKLSGSLSFRWFVFFLLACSLQPIACSHCAEEIKTPNVAGAFYPQEKSALSEMVDDFLKKANPEPVSGNIFAIIAPHAGYGFSGPTAAYAYKLIAGKPYKSVIVIAPSHYYGFSGVSVYPEGTFRTPLGDIDVDKEFSAKILASKQEDFSFDSGAFAKEHSLEVQLPFLQKVLKDFKIVPIVLGDVDLGTCKRLAAVLNEVIGKREDVLVVASTDLYHGYDFQEADEFDSKTISFVKSMDAEGLYYALREGKAQMCGGFGVVTAIMLAKARGHDKAVILHRTNSAEVTNNLKKGTWTVGYASCVIDKQKGEKAMLNKDQRKRLLQIARSSIENYLKTGKKLELTEADPLLNKEMGAFVTLREKGELRGCIGNMIGTQALYLTVRDMAIEAAVGDPRFSAVEQKELKDIEIEISVLSPLEKIDNTGKIKMGEHGVLIRKGHNSGIFLPQVATETGWSKEEFLSYLCSHKAGLPEDAWKDKSAEIFIFTAEVFSEKEY